MIANTINSSFFEKESGTMLMATTKIFKWDMKENVAMKVISQQ